MFDLALKPELRPTASRQVVEACAYWLQPDAKWDSLVGYAASLAAFVDTLSDSTTRDEHQWRQAVVQAARRVDESYDVACLRQLQGVCEEGGGV